ncbi:UvrD-helicase domain-containing protein [Sphingobacterium psychroaquaticum]|uniref:DNA 3'-5' helicase n=1 Tax=Sphingobacterium psychroaquaticum TaxID=561061 RepID=A0A1X7KJG2_9SPHI|nr:UvrD-helicase domain-containing protein [Sphingobacterium psychroaquaticum]SMG40770.1 ATP-dependent exoDNAse (exonuclease V) beta subunit (contains helicase and exonuclease domains) [Sphingobacterium psychroaquaticum]
MNAVAPLKILKASAGSGKTFSLTLHYITLLLMQENSYREILAVTFTNKATAEMKERVLSVLQGLATGDQRRKVDAFRMLLLEQQPTWTPQLIQEKAYRVFRKIIHDYGHFTISTIDGFSQKVIRSFTYELNLDAGYKIEMNSNKVKQDLTVMLNQLLDERPDLLEWIIAYAEKKIDSNENWNYRQQLLSLAGLIFTENFQEFNAHLSTADARHVFNLLNTEVHEKTQTFLEALRSAILLFSATIKTSGVVADDLKGKSRNKLFSASKTDPEVSKLSATELAKIFDKYLKLSDDEDAFTGADKSVRYDLQQLLAPVLRQFEELYQFFPTFIAYQSVQGNLYYLRLLKEMSDLLTQWRRENGAQLISDAQMLLSKLGLDENNDPTFIWEKIGNRYNYFLFDEFQDTSRIQWKNYSPLLINALGNARQEFHEHLIVGDVKQSIYRWRNGDWRILLQQVEQQVSDAFHLNETNRSTFIENGTLDTNYRSLPRIIALNNYLFSAMPQRLQEVLNEKVRESLPPEEWDWWETSGNDRMLIKAYENSQQEVPAHKQGADHPQGAIEIQYLPVEDGRYRRNQVMEESLRLMSEKVGEWISTGRYEPRQIGILVRSNTQAKQVIQQLMAYKNESGIAFEVISGDALSLVGNDAVLLLIETLKALVYQSDKHIIHRARMVYLYQLIQSGHTFDTSFWLEFKTNNLQDVASLLPAGLLAQWSVLQKLPLIHLVEKLIEAYGLIGEGSLHLPYILAFKDMVSTFSQSGERGISQFLTFWEEDGVHVSLPADGKVNAIEVTTIHKSKGLAYEVVMIPFCAWDLDGMINGDFWIDVQGSPFEQLGKIPLKYTGSVGQSIFYKQYFEEMLFNYMDALNTFYVAMTRAVAHLYITAPLFKETVDKKTGIVSGYDIKNDYISDLLYQVLDNNGQGEFSLSEGQLLLEEVVPQEKDVKLDEQAETGESRIHHYPVSLKDYPISVELQKAFDKSTKRTINNILQLEKAAQYGILAHEIMSEVSRQEEVLGLVDRYIEEGVLALEDRPFILHEIQQIWEHPVVSNWLGGDYKIWNEASIILENGETIRPDKVFTSARETIVLDFKFTQGDYAEHKWQVDNYMKALKNLGYMNVKGFLYYAKSNQLVEVI